MVGAPKLRWLTARRPLVTLVAGLALVCTSPSGGQAPQAMQQGPSALPESQAI
jgi:hypothetical protein